LPNGNEKCSSAWTVAQARREDALNLSSLQESKKQEETNIIAERVETFSSGHCLAWLSL
jgi:hypothetical protein